MSKFLGRWRIASGLGGFVVAIIATWTLAGAALAAGPAITAPPVISGAVRAGQTLSVSTGTWTSTDPGGITGYSYAWTSGGTPVGSDSASYPVTAADIGKEIAVTVSAADATGTTPAAAVSAGVVPAPPADSAPPTILGVVQQGQVLTASAGTWTGTAPITFSYQWTSGGSPVGTGAATYSVGPADVGKLISVAVTASNAGGGPVTAPLATVGPALPLPPANVTLPGIAGTPQQGQVLTLTPGSWANNPTLTSDQWEDCTALACTPVPGQTGSTYTVGAGDVGHTIQVAETAFNAAAPNGVFPVASARTAPASATSVTSLVVFSPDTPTTNQAVTLVATISSSSGNADPHGTLSFFNGSAVVQGCANKPVSGGQTITIVCQASFDAGIAKLSAGYVADPTSLVAGSVSDTSSVDVGKGSTSVSLAVTPQVAPGGRATYVATLGVPLNSGGPILPSGSVAFLDGGQVIGACASQPLSNLIATCSLTYAAAGGHSITARYGGDDNFSGATSSASGVQIVQGASKTPVVRAALGATVGWTIHYHPRYSWLSALTAFAVSKGTTILVQCQGKGCPFARWVIKHASGRVDLMRRFGHRHLSVGTQIIVRFTRRGWIGKSYTLTIRAGHRPRETARCLVPRGISPGAGCPST